MSKSIYIEGNEEFFIQLYKTGCYERALHLSIILRILILLLPLERGFLEISQLLVEIKNLGIPKLLSGYTTYFPLKEN